MNDQAQIWADPRLVYSVAAAAVALLLITLWLFRRRRKEGRQAAVICLVISIALHAALLFLVPMIVPTAGGSATVDPDSQSDAGIEAFEFSTFDPDLQLEDASGQELNSSVAPLPVANLTDLTQPDVTSEETLADEAVDSEAEADTPDPLAVTPPESLASSSIPFPEMTNQNVEPTPQDANGKDDSDSLAEIDTQLSALLDAAFAESMPAPPESVTPPANMPDAAITPPSPAPSTTRTATATAPPSTVAELLESDFANRSGDAKREALLLTGGSEQTEAAVEAAIRFLASSQRADGSWGSRASGGGVERQPLGISRGGAGSRADTAITGLALLTLMGAGHTHREGDYADNVFRGLAYLIRQQQPNGSLAGNATINASTYCHGMAALAMCEAAAITQDPNAIESSRRAIDYTQRIQHPTTGGWRYVPGDPGDLSQLGWQAMVLDAGYRAGITINPRNVQGVQRFLRRVRMGTNGGLACYRPGEAPSRTMTAEALATRLLIGESVNDQEITEAERYILQKLPGVGQDNYYYWYYATLALHQLQDDAWQQWNNALKQRLLSTQRIDGSWSSDTVWGGYGGQIYTTSMATLCLETYYRHAIRNRKDRIATQPSNLR